MAFFMPKLQILIYFGLLCCVQSMAQVLPGPYGLRYFDFSKAGYRQGQQLPSRHWPEKKTFAVQDFGAIANDGKDDIEAIQRAVDAAEKAGGGIVLFPPGRFDFDVESAQRFVWIKSSHIIIRGYGEGEDGTILVDHKPSRSPIPEKKWLGGTFPSFFKVGHPFDSLNARQAQAFCKPAPAGSSVLELEQPVAIKPGTYLLAQINPENASLAYELAYPLQKLGSNHLSQEIKYAQMVRIERVQENRIVLDAPIHWRLKKGWRPCLIAMPDLLTECGIENLRLVSMWKDPFVHHNDDIHDSGWDQIHLHQVENSWIRNIVHDSPSMAVGLSWCKNTTVYDCQIIGNRGHNGFVLSGGSTSNSLFNLKGGAAMHTYSLNGYCSGNVFHQCISQAGSAIDCHGSLCHNNLFDVMYGPVVQNGGGPGATPPAHARGMVLYNLQPGPENAYNFRIQTRVLQTDQYPGLTAVGIRSTIGLMLEIQDQGLKKNSDFKSPFAEVKKLNYSEGRLSIPSLWRWQRAQKRMSELPEEKR